jgi:hypothetical protein
LDEILVTVTGSVATAQASWFYRNFFSTVATDDPGDMSIYAQYVQNPVSRAEVPALLQPQPGALPSGGMKEMRFALSGIFARSRYGGTIELRFQSIDDFAYEIVSGDTRWDIGNITMSVFITPKAAQLNPLAPQLTGFNPPKIEFTVGDVIAYSNTTGNVKADAEMAPLADYLEALATRLEVLTGLPFQRDANQFSHAWIHVQQQDLFDGGQPREIVDAIELGENHLALRTRRPTVHFSWSLKLQRTNVNLGALEVIFALSPLWTWSDEVFTGPTSNARLYPSESSDWMTMKTFRLDDECPGLEFLVFVQAQTSSVSGLLRHVWRTPDLVVPNTFERQTTVEAVLTTNCAAINNFIASLPLPTPLAQSANRVLYEVREQTIELGVPCDPFSDSCISIMAGYRISARLEILFL